MAPVVGDHHGQRLGLARRCRPPPRRWREFEVPLRGRRGLRAPHARRRCSTTPTSAAGRGLQVIIAGAGGAAHLPGMVASATPLPVIGVPVPLKYLDGMDSLLSIVQMPAGVPVATVSIGGARNAGPARRADPRRVRRRRSAARWTRFPGGLRDPGRARRTPPCKAEL